MAIGEIRRLGLYGLTENELLRYKTSVLTEAEQYAAQATQMGNEVCSTLTGFCPALSDSSFSTAIIIRMYWVCLWKLSLAVTLLCILTKD